MWGTEFWVTCKEPVWMGSFYASSQRVASLLSIAESRDSKTKRGEQGARVIAAIFIGLRRTFRAAESLTWRPRSALKFWPAESIQASRAEPSILCFPAVRGKGVKFRAPGQVPGAPTLARNGPQRLGYKERQEERRMTYLKVCRSGRARS